jgi:hypothetical protein
MEDVMSRTWMTMTVLLFVGACCAIPSPCGAATADVTAFFNAVWLPPPSDHMKIAYTYEATWDTPGLECKRTVRYWENSVPRVISSGYHYTSPVNTSGTDYDTFHSEGSGRYYKIEIEVTDGITTYASDARVDGDWY